MQRLDPLEFDPPDPGGDEDFFRRKDKQRVAAAFVGAILLHSSLAFAFVNLQADSVEPPGDLVITVDLAPAMVSDAIADKPPAEASEPVPQEETPPEPEIPEEVVEDVKPEPLPEEPAEPEPEVVEEQKIEPPPPVEKAEVVMPAKPKPKPKPKPKSKPKPKPQAPQAASATNAPRADIAGSGARASPSEIAKYSGRVRAAVERNKRIPSVSRGVTGRVHIVITISRSGSVTGLRIARSSGNAALDAAARQAVATANIPPIPDGLPDAFNIGVPITYNIR